MKSYSINYNHALDQQKGPAPNVTVTAALSLSGVLQSQGVPSLNDHSQQQHQQQQQQQQQQAYKRIGNININPNDNSRLLQQLIVQQHKLQEGKCSLAAKGLSKNMKILKKSQKFDVFKLFNPLRARIFH